MALSEAISHLNKGMELVANLPASSERDAIELDLRAPLGTAWMALKGWAAPEASTSFHPALSLAKSLGRNDAMLPILANTMLNLLCMGRVAESLSWLEEMLETGKATGNSDLVVTGHAYAVTGMFYWGRLTESLQHFDKVLALYDEDKHGYLANLLNHDIKAPGVFASHCTWMLGYPDQAVKLFDEALAHARRIGHPFNLGWLLTVGADLFEFRCEADILRTYAQEGERIGRENSLPFLWACLAPIRLGFSLIRDGKTTEGIISARAGLDVWDASGGKVHSPYLKSLLAEGLALSGDLDGAIQLVDEQIEQVERPGWEERYYYAEILRLKGWMLTLKNDLEGAEKHYLASLDWAREQQAKSWELRTSTSLARLWQQQGKRKEAHDLLAPVYEWFTEGFDTKDLKDAKALLDKLSA
jgi:hypothetical protein